MGEKTLISGQIDLRGKRTTLSFIIPTFLVRVADMAQGPSMKQRLNAVLESMSLFGIYPLKFINTARGLQFYLRDYINFKRQLIQSKSPFPMGKFYPCLDDLFSPIGVASGHYFHQDLLVASKIYHNGPRKHVDIGSRIDGFVAHVASFREIEVIDIRPLDNEIKNIKFIKMDMMDDNFTLIDYCDSVSSLHAIEHFGLGRYGDRVDYNGHIKGLKNIRKLLKVGGKFYLSVPIGRQIIEFNGQRVFDVRYLLDILDDKYKIDSFSFVNDKGDLIIDASLNSRDVEHNYSCYYGCGIFELTKL